MTAPSPRYPGSPPFSDSEVDRLLFRGRAAEAEDLANRILSTDLVVVYGVSGTGKTSLMQAGVFHRLREAELWPVTIRLNDPTRTPVELIAEAMVEHAATEGLELLPADPAGADLWELLAGLEVWRGDVLLTPVLVLDQFEELFTLDWDPAVRERFLTEFGWVSRGHRPLEHGGVAGRPPAVKSVILVREDSLGELEEVAGHVPHVMRNRFRLRPLGLGQAEEAIRGPARQVDDRLESPPFEYDDDAVALMLDFLRTREERGRTVKTDAVDPSQLQIICQYVEDVVVRGRGDTQVSAGDLGGRDGLNRILQDFYRRSLAALPDEYEASARELCEAGLINSSGRRLSLEVGQIEDHHGVPEPVLDRMVAARLLRAEARTGSRYFELAHDSLVQPILDARAQRLRQRAESRRRRVLRLGLAAAAAALVGIAVWGWVDSRGGGSLAGDETQAEEALRTVAGTVVGHDAQPLVGATVHVHRVLGEGAEAENGGVVALELTDASGAFSEELSGGTYRIEVTARDYQPGWWGGAAVFADAADVVIDESREPPELTIGLTPLQGQITYTVAAGAASDVRAELDTGEAREGQEGTFTVPTPGDYTVTFAATGFEDLQVAVELGPGHSRDLGTVALVAEGPDRVEVTFVKLIDGQRDAVVTAGAVQVEYQIANNGADDLTLQGIADAQLPGGRLDLTGRRLRSREVISPTATLTISEAVECSDPRPAPATLLLAGGETVEAQTSFCTVSAGLVSAVVFSDVDGDGTRAGEERGLPGVEVLLEAEDASVESLISDEFGRVEFPSVPAGAYTVSIAAIPGTRATTALQQRVFVPADADGVAFGVQAAVELSGVARLAGEPLVNITVSIGGDIQESTTTDEQGRFRFAVYAGDYELRLPGALAGTTVAVGSEAVTGADLELQSRPPVAGLPPGLFCRDLLALGYGFREALEYWTLEGRPSRMDADDNERPCETVYAQEAIDAVLTATTRDTLPKETPTTAGN